MHSFEVTILEPQAEEVLNDLESKNLVRLRRLDNNGNKKPLMFGCMKGLITYISPDFDEPLEDFKDYM